MATAAFTPLGIFNQGQTLIRLPKDLQTLLPSHGRRQDMLWQFTNVLAECNNQLYMGDSMIKRDVLLDVQDRCTRQEKILKFLMSISSIAEDKDVSLMPDLIRIYSTSSNLSTPSLFPMGAKFCLYDARTDGLEKFLLPQRELYASKSLLEFVGTLPDTSIITIRPNGNVLFSGNGSGMKDLLSIVDGYDLSKNLSNGNKKATVVPYFTWKRNIHARTNTQGSISNLETVTDAPLKRTSKSKPMPKKKKSRKVGRERDMYSKNYFHACESFLNVYLDRNGDSTSILSLKNSAPELTQALHQFSAGIAGTGLAVLLSVAFESANGRVLPKLFSVSFGFGLFWLSWSVKRLQDSISSVGKKSNKGRSPDREVAITREVERSVSDILFRAAALMAVAVLRLG